MTHQGSDRLEGVTIERRGVLALPLFLGVGAFASSNPEQEGGESESEALISQ